MQEIRIGAYCLTNPLFLCFVITDFRGLKQAFGVEGGVKQTQYLLLFKDGKGASS
jgi:hypothetical protein